MPAHLHGYKVLQEKNVDIRIAALCARKIEDARRFTRPGEGPPPREPVGPPGDPLNIPHIYVYDFQTDTDVSVYSDYREMLKKADIDAVDIYTSVSSHHQIALAGIEAGKHVLVEKPFAITVRAAQKIVDAADRAGTVLGVAENARYFPETRMTRWVIDQGYIGDLQIVVSGGIGGYWSPDMIVAKTPWRHKKISGGGGATIDVGVHLFDILRYLCGEIEEVSSFIETFEKTRFTRDETGRVVEETESDVDDTFLGLVKFRNNAIGQILLSWGGHGEPLSIPRTIYGTKGCIKGNTVILDEGTGTDVKNIFAREAKAQTKDRFFPGGITDPMALETLEFVRAIEDRREMETSGREGLRDLAASYALIESSRMGKSVKVDDVESGRIKSYEEEINRYYSL